MPNRRTLNTTGGAAFRFPKATTSPATAGERVYSRGEDGTICFVDTRNDGLYLTHIVADPEEIARREGVSLEELQAGTIMVIPQGSFGKKPAWILGAMLFIAITLPIVWWFAT